MKSIQVDGKSPFVPASLDVLGKPAFGRRGMHFNGWPFGYPYAFRRWREKDWCCFLDILSYQGVNLFYLWPFIEIMPVPLSPEDQEYLEECRRVVDYAQKKHGMEVWIMQCTNRVAKDRCGVNDPRQRPYWRPSQRDLDPRNPQHLQAILSSREAMYRIVDNVDGVCNIDSDPGVAPPGSTVSDYVKVLQGCRALLDRHNIHGRQTKLIHWMWFGWGCPAREVPSVEHQLLTIQSLKQGLPEPWWLVCGKYNYLPMCRQEGLLEKTVLLPYGQIEREPIYPATNVQIDRLRTAFVNDIYKYPELAGVMGNVQTALLQFPHVYFFTSAMSDAESCRRSEKEILEELAGHFYPEHRRLVADSFLALKEPDEAKVATLAEQLGDVIRDDRLGQSGVFGRKLFPDRRIVAKDLFLQLRLREARERLQSDIASPTPRAECEKLLYNYFDAYLTWDIAHGWHTLWGWTGGQWNGWPLGHRGVTGDAWLSAVARQLRASLGDAANVDACFNEVGRMLSTKHDPAIVQMGCIAPMKKAVLASASPSTTVP